MIVIVKALEKYDASVYPYNCCTNSVDGSYYLFVHTASSKPLVIRTKEGSAYVYSFDLREDSSYLLYRSVDKYEWQLIAEGSGKQSDLVSFVTSSSTVKVDEVNIEIEITADDTEQEKADTSNIEVNVTVGEEVTEMLAEIQKANLDMVEAQHIANGLIGTVLFFFIFVWAEKRIKHAVRSFTGRGLDE